jgi:hypothetical protein
MIDKVKTLRALIELLNVIVIYGPKLDGYEVYGYKENGERFKIEVKTKEVQGEVIPIRKIRPP